jgi:hypothetical protein
LKWGVGVGIGIGIEYDDMSCDHERLEVRKMLYGPDCRIRQAVLVGLFLLSSVAAPLHALAQADGQLVDDSETQTPMASPIEMSTPTPPFTTSGSNFEIEGCVVHFSGCGGSREFGVVRLSPLGRTASVRLGYFSFEDVPPGSYTLTYSPACNPAGRTGPVHLRITDSDGYAAFGRSDCVADCSANYKVTVDEVVHCVSRALNGSAGCPLCDANGDYRIAIDDLLQGVDAMLTGCY